MGSVPSGTEPHGRPCYTFVSHEGGPVHYRSVDLRLTRRLLRSIKRQIREVQGPEDEEVAAYYRPYSRELEHCWTRPVLQENFLAAGVASPLVLVGDFHTLDQAQHIFLRLLKEFAALGARPIVVLEMVNVHHDKAIARYLNGRLDEAGFLGELDYIKHWGFDFSHYKPIFDHAREEGLMIRGLNREGSLARRDALMAERIQDLVKAYPTRTLLVQVGDLHLASGHLPAELTRFGLHGPVLFQNSEAVFMRKLAARQDPFGWWSLGKGRYLNNNTPPPVKMQTFLTWLEHGGEVLNMLYGHRRATRSWSGEEIDLSDTVARYVKVLKDYFGLHLKTDDDYQVYLYKDLSFLRHSFFLTRLGRVYKAMILDGRPLYVHQDKTIYLPMLDVNRTVQETMHYLMGAPLPVGQTFNAFMARIHYFASGYIASKMVNPMRHSPTLLEMERAVKDYPLLQCESDRRKLWRQIQVYGGVLEFFGAVRLANGAVAAGLSHLLGTDMKSAFSLSEQIGRTLGDDIHRLYDAGRLSAADLKRYAFTQKDPLFFEARRLALRHAT